MIQKDFYKTREDGVNLYRTYSGANMMIRKDGTDEMYSEAVDIESAEYTYTETSIPIGNEEYTDTEKAEAYDIIVGGGAE